MEGIGVAMAQLAGIRKAAQSIVESGGYAFPAAAVGGYFVRLNRQLKTIRNTHPDLFGDVSDVPEGPIAVDILSEAPSGKFHISQLQQIVRTVDEVFEIRANCELTMPVASPVAALRRVFITHGRAQDWRQIQTYIEKDLKLDTLELAQQASGGATIIEKLERAAEECDCAVIVMTGDDTDGDGQAKARENVMHEIGYFHGKYGRPRVILLHEDGVSVPTNLAGIVYVPFPKGTITAAESTLARELRRIYGAP